MQSNKANAVWASQTYSQTVGLNNWAQYQLSLTGSSYRFNINSSPTTSTNLQYYTNREGVNITAGDSILLSTNGTSFSSGTAGVVSFVAAGATSISSTGLASSLASNTNANIRKGSQYMSPDGLNFYIMENPTLDGVTFQVLQFALSTAFDISTMTYTGKASFNISDPNGYGPSFTFKTDGTILYVGLYTTGLTDTIKAYALGTAWDISTASSSAIGSITITKPSNSGGWAAQSYGFISFSPDGTQLIGCNTNSAYVVSPTSGSGNGCGNFAIYTLSVPWVINTCVTTTTNWTNSTQSIFNSTNSQQVGFWLTPDGRTIVTASKTNASANLLINTIPLAGAYTLGNGTTSLTINSVTAGNFSSQSNPAVQAYFSANGTSFTINQSNSSPNRFISTGNDLYGKYNVNISSFSLGAAPTFAYNAAPTVSVDAETTAARVNLFPYQVYQASSTTSQAVIYKPTSGYVAAGDAILLNGTTSVTTTSVTEGTNLGVAAVPITTAANRNYASKVFGLPVSTSGIETSFRISPDGGTMIVGLRNGTYGTGLYQYTLTTPFDINTATFANKFVSCTADNVSTSWAQGYGTVSFDVVPDGSRLVLIGGFVTGSATAVTTLTAREYTMSQVWDIGTIRPTGVTWNSTLQINTSNAVSCFRFVPNGSQFVYVVNDQPASGTTITIYYVSCGTAYRIGTAASGTGTQYGGGIAAGQGEVRSVTFTPDGLNIITQGSVTTSNTLGTANNMATATTANSPNSATTKWAWPSGTMTASTARAFAGEFSPDGTKYYVMNGDGVNAPAGWNNIWQMNVMVIPQTSYTCNFATQGSAPTSVVIPDRSVAQTITTTLSGGNMTFAASAVSTNARGIATKITAPGNFTTVTNATFSLIRS